METGLTFFSFSFSWCSHEDGVFLLYIVSILRQELRSLTNLSPNLREVTCNGHYQFLMISLLLDAFHRTRAVLLLSLWLPIQESKTKRSNRT